jgi:hypothetical protein
MGLGDLGVFARGNLDSSEELPFFEIAIEIAIEIEIDSHPSKFLFTFDFAPVFRFL